MKSHTFITLLAIILFTGNQKLHAQYIDSAYLNAPLPSNVILYNNVSNIDLVFTGVLTSVNLVGSYSNLSSALNKQTERDFELIASLTGIAQFYYGARLLIRSREEFGDFVFINRGMRNIGLLNMTVGGFTLGSALFNLIRNHGRNSENGISWNIFTFPTPNERTGLAFSFSKTF